MSRDKGFTIKQGLLSQAVGTSGFLTITKNGVLRFSKRNTNFVKSKLTQKTKK